jgi:hypothetical protein
MDREEGLEGRGSGGESTVSFLRPHPPYLLSLFRQGKVEEVLRTERKPNRAKLTDPLPSLSHSPLSLRMKETFASGVRFMASLSRESSNVDEEAFLDSRVDVLEGTESEDRPALSDDDEVQRVGEMPSALEKASAQRLRSLRRYIFCTTKAPSALPRPIASLGSPAQVAFSASPATSSL